jgi:flagellin
MASFRDFNRVNTNVSSLGARLSLNKINGELGGSRLRLSTGKRINSAEDNSAGYAIATKLNSRVVGLQQALQNVSDTKSMLDVVENAYNSIIDNLIKLKSLATQAASGTIATGSDEMTYLASQIEAIGDEINDIADKATFNGKDLIGSSENDTFSIQTGEGNTDIMDIGLSEISMNKIFPDNSLRYPSSYGSFNADFDDGDLSEFDNDSWNGGSISVEADSFDGSNMVTLDGSAYGGRGSIRTNSFSAGYGTYAMKFRANDTDAITKIYMMDGLDLQTTLRLDTPNARILHNGTVTTWIDSSTNYNEGEWIDLTIEVTPTSAKLLINDNLHGEIPFSPDDNGNTFMIREIKGSSSIDNVSFTPYDENIVIDANTVTNSDMRDLVNNVDTALDNMNSKMNELGINQRSLSSKQENLTQAISANSAAHSRIMDTDFAKEQSNSIRLQILQQTATAALSQANMGPQAVLGFLGQ